MKLILKNVRLAFPVLWTPEPFPEGDDPTPYYSASFLIPKTDPMVAEINAVIKATAVEKWGAKADTMLKSAKANNKLFLKDGDLKTYDGFEGMYYVSARTKVRPRILDRQKTPLAESDGKPYAGCVVLAILGTYGYDKGSIGVGAGLQGIQFVRDGDAFGGARAASEEEFEDLGVEEDATA